MFLVMKRSPHFGHRQSGGRLDGMRRNSSGFRDGMEILCEGRLCVKMSALDGLSAPSVLNKSFRGNVV
jgi:hypothetical protein